MQIEVWISVCSYARSMDLGTCATYKRTRQSIYLTETWNVAHLLQIKLVRLSIYSKNIRRYNVRSAGVVDDKLNRSSIQLIPNESSGRC